MVRFNGELDNDKRFYDMAAWLFQTGIGGMVVCAILITIAQNVKSDDADVGSGVGIFLIVSTLVFVVFFALGPGLLRNICPYVL